MKTKNPEGQLLVDEHHHTKEYTALCFNEKTRTHNGIPYRMMSLESIYNSKKNSRPKDRYDASIIEDSIDKKIESRITQEQKACYIIRRKPVTDSVIHALESYQERKTLATK